MALKDRLIDKIVVGDYVSTLLFSRNQAHTFHWQTKSFAKHKALEEYYTDIIDLIDSLVETYQGTKGIINIFSNSEKYAYGEETVINYFVDLLSYIESNRILFDGSDMQNIIDEIVSLVKNTLYRLKNLS